MIKKGFVVELIVIVIICCVFLFVNLNNLTNWYFSAIGDEYAFFDYAKSIALGKSFPNIFLQRGVYDVIPVLSSYYQALSMKIFGINVFGWKASHVILISATIPAIYFLTKKMFNTITATISTSFYSSSHVLWAYTHTGYSNIESLFPTIFSLTFFAHKMFFLSGIFAGLAFYTYYISRITIFIIICWVLICRKQIKVKSALLQILLGFSILFLPFLIINRNVFFHDMFVRSVIAQNDGTYYDPRYKFIFDNIIRNGLALWHNTRSMCYVSGSMLDLLTGAFFIIGFIILLRQIIRKNVHFLMIAVFFLISFLCIAVFSPYGYTVVSRQFFIIPSAVIIAGIGVNRMVSLVKQIWMRRILLSAIIFFTFLLNAYRFFVQTPKIMPVTSEALIMKELLSDQCRENSLNIVIGAREKPFNLLHAAIKAYEIDNKTLLIEFDKKINPLSYQNSCILSL
jgi:4-amino-4-deoxy-L-arabinose transferase-like glycosyltransferase